MPTENAGHHSTTTKVAYHQCMTFDLDDWHAGSPCLKG